MASSLVMFDILQEHFEELDFLWEQRERILFAPDRTVTALVELEDRAEAHLDGLRIGGQQSVELARPYLAGEDSSSATAGAFVMLEAGLPNDVLDAATTGHPNARRGIGISLRHSVVAPVTDQLYELSVGSSLEMRAFAADLLAFHRLRPPPEMDRLLAAEDPAVRRLAYRAAGRCSKVLNERHVEEALHADDPILRRIALEAGARAGLLGTLPLCRQAARRVPEAVSFLGVIGTAEDLPLFRNALGSPDLARDALDALGSLGHVAGVPMLLDAMETPAMAEAAGAAFERIVGPSDLISRQSELDNPDDEPLPDPDRARAVWERVRPRLQPTGRWQTAVDVSEMRLDAAMATMSLRTRSELYLAARLNNLGATPDLELEDLVRRPVVALRTSLRGATS